MSKEVRIGDYNISFLVNDDILLVGNKLEMPNETKSLLSSIMEMKTICEKLFTGLRSMRNSSRKTLNLLPIELYSKDS